MNKSRLEWKVGLFLVISLAMAGGLIMKFSKGTSIFTRTYEILLTTSDVGGIMPGAAVLMAGVQVGTVEKISLHEGGRIATMHAQIQARFRIHQDARFTIEQAGFLGDQYVSVTPRANKARPLTNGDTVSCEEPFNLQETARSASGLLQRFDEIAAKLSVAVGRIDQTVLSQESLTNLSATVANFRRLSEGALTTLQGVNDLVQTNIPALTTVITNLVLFSEQVGDVADELQVMIATNRVEITTAIQNFQAGTLHLSGLLNDLQAGKGLAGSVLKDDLLQQQFVSTVSNLNVLSSNLSQHGLLWRPRGRRVEPDTSIYTGRNPTR